MEKLMQLPSIQIAGSRTFSLNKEQKKQRRLNKISNMKKKGLAQIDYAEKLLENKKDKIEKLEKEAKVILMKFRLKLKFRKSEKRRKRNESK